MPKQVGVLDTKLGQALLGAKDKEGKPTGGFSLSKIAGLGATALSLIQSAKTPKEAGENLAAATGNPYDRQRGEELFGMLDSSIFEIDDRFVLPAKAKDGGLMRTKYAMGSEDPKPLPNDPTEPVNPFKPKPIGPVLPDRMADIPRDLNLEEAKEMFIKFTGREPLSMQELLEFFNVKEQAAEGGLMRENYALGSMPTAEESGLGGLPIEADMRYTGGFMPYGAKEKADDVPARLSKNEFVFTADAVRAAGGGSVQKGAQKMYNTMKQLESQPEAKGMMAMAEQTTTITAAPDYLRPGIEKFLEGATRQAGQAIDTSTFAPSVVGHRCITTKYSTTSGNTSWTWNITI